MKSKKILSVFLSVLMMVLTISPITAFAQSSTGSSSDNFSVGEDFVQNKKTQYTEVEESNTKTEVALTIEDSSLIVSVPTTIIVSGTPNKSGEYIGNYSIGVSGDMSGNKEVTIAPETSNIELLQKGKTNHDAAITQEKTSFDSDDFKNNVTTTGTVTATGLTAGSWNGVTNFNIGVNILPVEPLKGYTTLYEYDLSATENDNVKAYYAVPNKNTTVVKKSQRKAPKARANSADSNTIEYNGVVYTLSDEDTLVISGNGKMKEDIQSELIDYKGIQTAVATEFNITEITKTVPMSDMYTKDGLYLCWQKNEIHPGEIYGSEAVNNDTGFAIWNEICDYIDNILNEYAISMPTKIDIQEGVTNISKNAFYNCYSLKNITIASTVTDIFENAFHNCDSLTNVIIPNSVKNIGKSAFSYCDGLTNITIPDSVISIGTSAFYNCTNLTTVKLSNYITTIPGSLFAQCIKLKSINIPENAETIEGGFIADTKIEKIVIPPNVKNISSSVFDRAYSLNRIEVSVDNQYYTSEDNILFNNTETKLIRMLIGDEKTSYTIPNTVTDIDTYAFCDCDSLINVIIPNSVKNIGKSAFYNCDSLINVIIPNSVISIGTSAFYNCDGLTSIIIDSDLKLSLADSPFKNCDNLAQVIFGDNVTRIPDGMFRNIKSLTDIKIGKNVKNIGSNAFNGCTGLKNIMIPSNVTYIGSRVFDNIGNALTIYCENQSVANLILHQASIPPSSFSSTVVVAPEMFE